MKYVSEHQALQMAVLKLKNICIFLLYISLHLKLELLKQFSASNDRKYLCMKKDICNRKFI